MKNSSRLPAPLFRLSVQNIKIAPPKTGFFRCFSCLFMAILYPLCQLLKKLLLINRRLHICTAEHITAFLLQMLAKRWFCERFWLIQGCSTFPKPRYLLLCHPFGAYWWRPWCNIFRRAAPTAILCHPVGAKNNIFYKKPQRGDIYQHRVQPCETVKTVQMRPKIFIPHRHTCTTTFRNFVV